MNAWQTQVFNPEQIVRRFNNRDTFRANYFDKKIGSLAESYLEEIMNRVEMSSLVKVIDNCHFSQKNKICPVLIQIND